MISLSCDWKSVYVTDEIVANFRPGADCTSAKLMSTLLGSDRAFSSLGWSNTDATDKKSDQIYLLQQINLASYMTLTLVILYAEKALAVLHVFH